MSKIELVGGKKLEFRIEASRRIAADKFSFFCLIICVFAIFSQIALILTSWGKLPPQLPLFYSRPWGADMLSPTVGIWILPALAIFALVLNFLLGFLLSRENFFLMRVLLVFASIISVSALYDVVKIISLLV